MAAARRGDRAAYGRVARDIGPGLNAAALEELGKPQLAADATRRALVEVWRDLPSLRQPGRLDKFAMTRLGRLTNEIRRQRPAEGTIVELRQDSAELRGPALYIEVALDEIATARQRSGPRRLLTFVNRAPLAARWAVLVVPLAIGLFALASMTGVVPPSPVHGSDPMGDVRNMDGGQLTDAFPSLDIVGVSVQARDSLEVTLNLAAAPATNRENMNRPRYALQVDVDLDGHADYVYTLIWESGVYIPLIENVNADTRRSLISFFDPGEGTSLRMSVPLDLLGDPTQVAIVVSSEGPDAGYPFGQLFADQLPDEGEWLGPVVVREVP